jgi:hypothetical protein
MPNLDQIDRRLLANCRTKGALPMSNWRSASG